MTGQGRSARDQSAKEWGLAAAGKVAAKAEDNAAEMARAGVRVKA